MGAKLTYALKSWIGSLPGWHTSRKIVVIESDDWGSIRMPSIKALYDLKALGLDLSTGDSARYNQYDTMASAVDLEALFEVLRQFKDGHGNHPVITALSLTANPDFERIAATQFQTYHNELITETLQRYYPNQPVFTCWKQGYKEQLFFPQFHGREHLHVNAWMHALQRGDKESMLAFERGMWGFNNKHSLGVSYQAAFDLESDTDLLDQQTILKEGLQQFEFLHGYKASFLVPPNGILHESLCDTAAQYGIEFMYSARLHEVPVRPGVFSRKINYLGKRNKAGQILITRNAFFEPSQGSMDCVAKCLAEIEMAFRWNKPAIISSHRVNYIGALHEHNRKNGLEQLSRLLTSILKRWPEVEFMNSEALGRIIKDEKRD